MLWEDLYQALIKRDANTKVILTVRDSDAAWWKSWCGFMLHECQRVAVGDLNGYALMTKLAPSGYLGPELEAMSSVTGYISASYLDAMVAKPDLSVKKVTELHLKLGV